MYFNLNRDLIFKLLVNLVHCKFASVICAIFLNLNSLIRCISRSFICKLLKATVCEADAV